MKHRLLVPAAALVLAAAAFWPSSAVMQDAPSDPRFEQFRERFHGTWHRAVPEARARRIVDSAIERTVNAMNFFVRGIARDQLRENTPLNARIDLLFGNDGTITVVFDNDRGRRYRSRPGRTVRVRTPSGDEMRVTQRLHADGRLEQVFETGQGTRWNVYRATGEGRIEVDATTQGMMMPQPMLFTFEYTRQR